MAGKYLLEINQQLHYGVPDSVVQQRSGVTSTLSIAEPNAAPDRGGSLRFPLQRRTGRRR